jgi:two-component system nitrogen regulation response regulator NtrX
MQDGVARLSLAGHVGNCNIIERMAILATSERITCESIPMEIRSPAGNAATTSLEETRAQAERALIRKALEDSGWNVSAAARTLGIERTHLHKRMRALGLAKDKAI